MTKKEIYFSRDVYKEVSEKLGISEKVVEKAFQTFIKSYKAQIEEGDDILYQMPYLGTMMISKADAAREIERLKKRHLREQDPEEKEKLLNKVNNYRVRLKKVKIELEKIKGTKSFLEKRDRNKMLTIKQGLSTPENIRRKSLFAGETLQEVMNKQNKYAYEHYEENNLPVTL